VHTSKALVIVAVLLAGVSVFGVSDVGGTGQRYARYIVDMNNNGLSDSLDVATGLMRAFNPDTDFEDFYCVPDSGWVLDHGVLGPCVRDSIDRHLQVRYFEARKALALVYPVAKRRSAVQIWLVDPIRGNRVIFRGTKEKGLNVVEFVTNDSTGALMDRGRGVVHIRIDDDDHERPVAWRWWRTP
jgi:hypothetical protein